MPMDKDRYPPDWKRIARQIKERAGWKCQQCGKQCRRPGEPFDTHKRTLTVAHLNHRPEDCRPENLKAMCAPCHLRYDARHHAETRRKTHERKKGGEYMDEMKAREKTRAAASLIPDMPDKLKYYVLGYAEGYAERIEEHEQQKSKEERPA